MSTDDSHDLAQAVAEGLAQTGVAIDPLSEAVESYRVLLGWAGYSAAVSRGMAADYHAALLRMINR